MDRIDGIFIKKMFDNYFEAPLHVWEDFAQFMHRRTFEKNEIIKDVDQTENHIDIIVEGSVGVFFMDG